ncbi:MAG: hypothetical protein HY899_15995 [Deltaproteobacteria bacterium]|nr:hypothetical protein [Deltaproteobacteria bacterium]
MGGIGVVLNPNAAASRGPGCDVARLAELVGGSGEVVVTGDLAELDVALRRFHERGYDIVAVCGGDGSMCHAVSRVVQIWGEWQLPDFVALRGGTINNIARTIGGPARPDAMMAGIVAAYTAGRALARVERPLIRVNGSLYGNVVGAGLITGFLEHYYRAANPGPLSAAGLLLRCGISWLVGGKLIDAVVPRLAARAQCDGEVLPFDAFTIVLASSVSHIGLGVTPFYLSGRKHGYFHVLAGPATPGQLLGRVPRFRRGFPAGLDTLYDNMAQRFRVEFASPQSYTIDGELFPPVPVLELESGPTVRFVKGEKH